LGLFISDFNCVGLGCQLKVANFFCIKKLYLYTQTGGIFRRFDSSLTRKLPATVILTYPKRKLMVLTNTNGVFANYSRISGWVGLDWVEIYLGNDGLGWILENGLMAMFVRPYSTHQLYVDVLPWRALTQDGLLVHVGGINWMFIAMHHPHIHGLTFAKRAEY
jgi:hypothetical protein